MEIANIRTGPSAFISINGEDILGLPTTVEQQSNSSFPIFNNAIINNGNNNNPNVIPIFSHIGITYTGNPIIGYHIEDPVIDENGKIVGTIAFEDENNNEQNNNIIDWPFYFLFTDSNNNIQKILLNKKGILDIQNVSILQISIGGYCPEPAKLNIECEWKI